VFLRQEVERRSGETNLYEAVVDSLILWALEGTDPETGIFMSRQDLRSRIVSELPVATQMLDQLFDQRIEWLSSKDNSSGREVRWYKTEDRFCLPYEPGEWLKTRMRATNKSESPQVTVFELVCQVTKIPPLSQVKLKVCSSSKSRCSVRL